MNLRIMEHCWKEVFQSVLERNSLNYIRELCDNRNDHFHQEPHSIDGAARILETMNLLMGNIKADETVANLQADIDTCVASLKQLRLDLLASQNQPLPASPTPVPANSPRDLLIARHRLRKWSDDVIALKMSG